MRVDIRMQNDLQQARTWEQERKPSMRMKIKFESLAHANLYMSPNHTESFNIIYINIIVILRGISAHKKIIVISIISP